MKELLKLLCVVLLVLPNAAVHAQYPDKPVRLIVPYPPGGAADAVARLVSEAMQVSLGQSILVDNRPGAATNIGVAALLQSRPDGYTLMEAENAALLFNEHLFRNLPYKPGVDFAYVGAIGRLPVALVVAPSFPAKTLAGFIEHVRAHPGTHYASAGIGTPHHLAMELFKQKAGLSMTHVPYKGAAPALQDLMGGQVQTMMLDLGSGLQAIRAGKLRVLALAWPQRSRTLPDVPTFDELGVRDINASALLGLVGPAGMPEHVVTLLNASLGQALQQPKVTKYFADIGLEVTPGTPAEFQLRARSESARWGTVIKALDLQLD